MIDLDKRSFFVLLYRLYMSRDLGNKGGTRASLVKGKEVGKKVE